MHKIFLPIYYFFQKKKGLMYGLMIGTFIFFLFFGLKLRFEEEVIKLLPRSSMDNELAFSEVTLKDKIFIQLTASGENARSPRELCKYMDLFTAELMAQDTAGRYIAGILSRLDAELAIGAADYAFEHVPSFIDTAWYSRFDEVLRPEAIEEQMARNYEMVMADEEGTVTTMVTMDPLNLREVLMQSVMPAEGAEAGGVTIVDGHFFCPDKSAALAFMDPAFDGLDSGAGTRFFNLLTKTRQSFETAHPEVRILAFGNPLGAVSNASTIKHDLFSTVGVSLVIIFIFIFFCFHDWSFIWQQLIPVAYGTAFAMACMYWIKGYMSLLALGLGAIVLGVALSYCLHVLIHFYYVGDAERMLKEEATPVFLGCLTTIGAFMGLIFTESELLSDFGIFATFALIGNTLFALVFLPHLLRPSQVKFKHTKGFPLIEKINDLPWDRNKWLLGTLLILIIVGIIFSPKVKFDSDLRNLNYEADWITEAQDFYNEKYSDGYKHLYFANHSDNLDEALEANMLLEKRLDSLEKDGVVKSHDGLVPVLFHSTRLQEERIAAWKAYWTPEKKAEMKRNLWHSASKYDWNIDFTPFYSLLEADYQPGNLFESGAVPSSLMSNYIERQASGRYMLFTRISFRPDEMDKAIEAVIASPRTLVLDPFYYCRDMVEIVHDDFNTTQWISSLLVT